MAEHSKVVAPTAETLGQIIKNALIGSNQKKAFSGILLAIIAYLIYMKNKKSTTDNIKLGEERNKKKVTSLLFRKEERETLTLSSLKELRN
jgi:hypothetical protein